MNILPINQLSPTHFSDDIEKGAGFVLSELPEDDLNTLLALVKEQYLHTIQSVSPGCVAEYFAVGMEQYHSVYQPQHFEHASVWGKPARMLGPGACQKVLSLRFADTLRNLLGDFQVSDEESFGWPGVYWRLVRPGNSDVGPVHADKWFWDLGHGDMPDGYSRLKIWICLHAEPGKSGLRVVPHSQLKDDWQYHGEERNRMLKPVLDERESDLDLVDLPLSSGQFVLFHDKLLHGGMPNRGDDSRISLEFTLLVPSH